MMRFWSTLILVIVLFLTSCSSNPAAWADTTFLDEENRAVPLLDGENPTVIFFFTTSG